MLFHLEVYKTVLKLQLINMIFLIVNFCEKYFEEQNKTNKV